MSRLVALSSEREGLRRQLIATQDRLRHTVSEYDEAHDYRFRNSQADFENWVLEDVVEQEDGFDIEALLSEHVPRGSSEDEMRPVLRSLMARVDEVDTTVRGFLRPTDDTSVALGDLEERGLPVPPGARSIYEHVVDHIAEKELPDRSMSKYGLSAFPLIRDSALVANDHGTASRRLDESIAQEQGLAMQKAILEADEERIASDIAVLGKPVGVVSAIAILSLYSLLGIVLPVLVMAADPKSLSAISVVALVGLFIFGLFTVLGYMLWYARTLDDPIS